MIAALSRHCKRPTRRRVLLHHPTAGFTLVELLIATGLFLIVIAAIVGAFFSQLMLNEHSRNLTWATNDASRVMESMRRLNRGPDCTLPNAAAPGGLSWDAWLTGPGGDKSLSANTGEKIFVTCQKESGAYCAPGQMAPSGVEWHGPGPASSDDPIHVTVSVCWRHRNRTIGECTWNDAQLVAAPGAGTVVDAPASLSTQITCR